LKATWKEYALTAPTFEQLGNMKKFHKRQLVQYVNKKADLKKELETYQLFNNLKSGGIQHFINGGGVKL
jgi:hypothetical protein